MDEEYEILQSHECVSANEHQAVHVLDYKYHGWTLFIDHGGLEHEGEEEDMEYRIAIDFCPFCGTQLDNAF